MTAIIWNCRFIGDARLLYFSESEAGTEPILKYKLQLNHNNNMQGLNLFTAEGSVLYLKMI